MQRRRARAHNTSQRRDEMSHCCSSSDAALDRLLPPSVHQQQGPGEEVTIAGSRAPHRPAESVLHFKEIQDSKVVTSS